MAERVVAVTDRMTRMTRMATMRRRTALAARNTLLPGLSRIPALRTRLVREPAEPDYR